MNLLAELKSTPFPVQLAVPIAIIVGAILIGWIVELVVVVRLERFTRRKPWRGDNIIVRAFRLKVTFWSLLLGVSLALPYLPWSLSSGLTTFINQVLLVLFVLSLTILLSDISTGLVNNAIMQSAARPVLSIVPNILRATVYIVGFLIVLQVLSVSITPALAALGITGLGVSLAAQATLTDVISGVLLLAARQVRPGDYIELSTGEQGYVTDINWRTTCVRQIANNMVIIPNSKMTSTILTNYHAPETTLSVIVDVHVSYTNDLEMVERVTLEVAREVLQSVDGGVAEYEPLVRYNLFEDYGVKFSVILRGQEYTNQYLLKHEFIKRLHERYRQEGIRLPYPIQMVHLDEREPYSTLAASRVAHTAGVEHLPLE